MANLQPKVFHYRVYWEDTDAGGVVYHARYLNFLERARSDYLLALGFPQIKMKSEQHRLFVVTRVEMDFLSPARLEDELAVRVGVEQMKKASMVFTQTIERVGSDNEAGTLLIQAKVAVALLNTETFKPARMPSDLATALQTN